MPIFERVAADFPVTLKTANYTIVAEDIGTEVQFQSASTVTATLPSVSDVVNGFNVVLRNIGTGNLTISPVGGQTIDGSSTSLLSVGECRWIRNDGTTWKTISSGISNGLALGAGRFQSFRLRITNSAGTLQHNIENSNNLGASSYVSGISGASPTLANTPSGTDSSTDFVNGAKISSALNQRLILKSANLASMNSSVAIICSIHYNDTGTALAIGPEADSINVNGTTRTWFTLHYNNATTGAAFALNTTNIASGKTIVITVLGFLPDYA